MKKLIKYKYYLVPLIVILVIVPVVIIVRNVTPKNSEKKQSNVNIISAQLTVNTDKIQYVIGERVDIQITSLSNEGVLLCDSNLELSVIKDGETIEQPEVTHSPTCNPEDTSPLNPDYVSSFTPRSEGKYLLKIVNTDSNTTSQIEIDVGSESVNLSISRWGANKVSLKTSNRYPMKFILTANNDFAGTLIERIPEILEVVWYGPAKVEKSDGYQTVTWEVDIKKGETKEFTYEYSVSSDMANNFELGPAKLVSDEKTRFKETRPWNIAVNRE